VVTAISGFTHINFIVLNICNTLCRLEKAKTSFYAYSLFLFTLSTFIYDFIINIYGPESITVCVGS